VRVTDIGEDEACVVEDAEQEWVTERWSLSLRMGTPASNQRFYLIHQHLSQVAVDLQHIYG